MTEEINTNLIPKKLVRFIPNKGVLKRKYKEKNNNGIIPVRLNPGDINILTDIYNKATSNKEMKLSFKGYEVATEYVKYILQDLNFRKLQIRPQKTRKIFGATKSIRKKNRAIRKMSKWNIFATGKIKRVPGSFSSKNR